MSCTCGARSRLVHELSVHPQDFRTAAEGVQGDAKAAEQGLHRYGTLLSQLPPTVSPQTSPLSSKLGKHLPLGPQMGNAHKRRLRAHVDVEVTQVLSPGLHRYTALRTVSILGGAGYQPRGLDRSMVCTGWQRCRRGAAAGGPPRVAVRCHRGRGSAGRRRRAGGRRRRSMRCSRGTR